LTDEPYSGRRVLVLGLGITGRDVASVLAQRGNSVLASDIGDVDEETVRGLEALGVDVEQGSHDRARRELKSVDFIVPSPGISPMRGFLAEAIAGGAKVLSELDIAGSLASAPVIAVTGTNGKTTVCRLTAAMAQAEGRMAIACGNVELKFLTAVHDRPDADLYVVEASSFALAFCSTFRPSVSIITNLAPDHFDWHETFEHYRNSKAKIAANQTPDDLFLYPSTQPELADLAPSPGPRREAFGATERFPVFSERASHFADDADAAARAAAFVGVGDEAMARAAASFRFEDHRLAYVGEKDGVGVYDDAVSANPHATIAALRTFHDPVVLIAGGRSKVDLAPLVAEASRLRALVAIGEAAPQLKSLFEGAGVIVSIAASMHEAVRMAFESARRGDAVLLSPACASWDMFAGYAERGRAFLEACQAVGVAA
jgi:UDP-N-acetylmuramoylalanine--D-glutamate ligase